ncbi:prolyl-tRNA synthetase [bacterium]|jgi:prolyl-tRNA synthetase|nr:prolyl-tRNA synthetase [bacterium]MDP6659674.1 His/Gly/Thr/Pro-type tRNA ligase C-terminal domain-containing protein [Candidatus Paceibacterota bacterium]|tara:strand:+ start:13670 stop:14917 length:1248 start_codon:yes stop_codon:yes gene_type:complete
MRQSTLFTKTRKEAPKDEVSKNAELLIRAGFINKEMAGVYSYLPLGLRTLNKIMEIIRREMESIGGQETLLTTLQAPEVWKKSGRWDDKVVDVWFKTKLLNETEVGLANTHEEALTQLLKSHISSHKDLPIYPYQFQTKFRNELRSKSGLMRAREFIMKDLYSFSKSEEEFRAFYEECAAAYIRIFGVLGIGDRTYRTFASGGSFSKYSDEFQTVSEAGEDIIYVSKEKNIAINKEVYNDEVLADLKISKDELEEKKAIEVGNIFPLSTKFSDALGLTYKDEDGSQKPIVMGSYGIGPGRVMGTIAEILSDEKGLVWPETIAPYDIHLIEISNVNEDVKKEAERLYTTLSESGVEVLYDDREVRAGEKFAESDLIGIPIRIIVSEKTLAEGKYERVMRKDGAADMVNESALLSQT